MSNNFFEALHQIATDKGITREEIEGIVESAMLSAFKKQYGAIENVRVAFDRDKNTVTIITKKMVVKKPTFPAEEIAYERALKIRKDVNLGDEIFVEENPFDSFGRIAAQTAKQVIIQKIKEAEKNIVYSEYSGREGELINGYLQRKTKDNLFIDLGKTEGLLPVREQNPLERFKIGDRIKALILSVQKSAKGPDVILSRANPKFVERLFEMEIPEIYDGIVKIVKIVREPGLRTKVSVTSDRDDVDSVGACVGMKGIRIQSIVRELEGEKIDVVEHYEDKKIMAATALTPAKIKEIILTSDGGVIAVVDNDQYSFAVGRAGHNVRLAARLCGFDIDIKTEENYQAFLGSSESRSIVDQLFSGDDMEETPLDELVDLEPRIVKILEKAGIFSVEDLVERSFEDLMKIEGIGEKTAQRILEILADAVDFDEGGESKEVEDSSEDDQA